MFDSGAFVKLRFKIANIKLEFSRDALLGVVFLFAFFVRSFVYSWKYLANTQEITQDQNVLYNNT